MDETNVTSTRTTTKESNMKFIPCNTDAWKEAEKKSKKKKKYGNPLPPKSKR